MRRTTRRVLAGGLAGLVVVVVGAVPTLGRAPSSVAGAATSTITEVMTGIEEGTAEGATTEFLGWGLSAIGLGDAQDQDFAAIESELATISSQLTDIENELTVLASDITTQTCALETFDTTTDARARIDTLTDELQQFEAAGATTSQLDQFVYDVLNGTSSIPTEMSVINDGLLNAGTADGIISSCLATIATPSAGSAGDTAYYDLVSNLTMFFYGYQVRGLNLIAEAYHYQAMAEWLKSNDASSASTTSPASICDGAGGNVAVYCNDAAYWTTKTYQNLQDQFALAGAPYSVSGEALTMNGTPYLFVSSLEAFSAAQGSSCSSPLTSASPCGPASGTNLLTSFSQPNAFANRTSWVPVTAAAWQKVLTWWTTSDETLGAYLTGLGFSNTTNGTKIVLTNDTYTATPSEYINGVYGPVFTAQAGCFVDFSLQRSFSPQPFCFNGSNGGLTYGDSFTLISKNGYYNNDYCGYVTTPDALPSDSSNSYFYTGTYYVGGVVSSCNTGWENGTTPGWLLKTGGYTAVQYLWPMFDMSTATCTTDADGSSRSTTNASGVYTMCGSDFDSWFASIVPAPTTMTATLATAAEPTATASPSTLTRGQSFTLTSTGWRASTAITVGLDAASVLEQPSTDHTGSLSRTYTVPADAALGPHTLSLDGNGVDGATHHATVTITVVDSAAAIPVTGTPALTG